MSYHGMPKSVTPMLKPAITPLPPQKMVNVEVTLLTLICAECKKRKVYVIVPRNADAKGIKGFCSGYCLQEYKKRFGFKEA